MYHANNIVILDYIIDKFGCHTFDCESIFLEACSDRNLEIVEFLINKVYTKKDNYIDIAFGDAIISNNLEVVKYLLDRFPKINVGKYIKNRCKPINNIDTIEFLITNYECKNIKSKYLYYIFCNACKNNKIDFVNYLIENFPKINIHRHYEKIFRCVCCDNNFELAQLVKRHYPEIDHQYVYNNYNEDIDDSDILVWLQADCPLENNTKSARN